MANKLDSYMDYVVEQWAGDNQACYCAARQLPRVEYSYCKGVGIQACADDLVSNGWYPLQGISSHHKNPNGQDQDYWQWEVQAFWRWAE